MPRAAEPATASSRDIGNQLRGVDWSFSLSRHSSVFDCRKYHWYPATFIPEIPFSLVEILSEPGDTVYDPFSGIGTTVMQALFAGRVPHGSENCRVAANVSRSLWTLLATEREPHELTTDVRALCADYNPLAPYEECFSGADSRRLLGRWFAPGTFRQLAYLALAVDHSLSSATAACVRLVTSSVLKSLSAQRGGWGCVADNMIPRRVSDEDERDVFRRLLRGVTVLARDLEAARKRLPSAAAALLKGACVDDHLCHADVAKMSEPPVEDVDLVVTSPPYPGMTDYATSQRLSYYWLGQTPDEDLASEIGARRKRFARSSIAAYGQVMTAVFGTVVAALRSGGVACFVLPQFDAERESDEPRRRVVQEVLGTLPGRGLVLEYQVERVLPTMRRHHNASWTTLEREAIYVYRKVD